MSKIFYQATLFLSLVLLFSCNGNNKEKEEQEEVESLKSEVIGTHDEVMPKMDKIMQLKAQLEQSIAETYDRDSTKKVAIERQLIIDLEAADAAMMVWMRNYDPMMEDMSHEEKLMYLEDQNNDIQQVKEQMLSAISRSEDFLKENK